MSHHNDSTYDDPIFYVMIRLSYNRTLSFSVDDSNNGCSIKQVQFKFMPR